MLNFKQTSAHEVAVKKGDRSSFPFLLIFRWANCISTCPDSLRSFLVFIRSLVGGGLLTMDWFLEYRLRKIVGRGSLTEDCAGLLTEDRRQRIVNRRSFVGCWPMDSSSLWLQGSSIAVHCSTLFDALGHQAVAISATYLPCLLSNSLYLTPNRAHRRIHWRTLLHCSAKSVVTFRAIQSDPSY